MEFQPRSQVLLSMSLSCAACAAEQSDLEEQMDDMRPLQPNQGSSRLSHQFFDARDQSGVLKV